MTHCETLSSVKKTDFSNDFIVLQRTSALSQTSSISTKTLLQYIVKAFLKTTIVLKLKGKSRMNQTVFDFESQRVLTKWVFSDLAENIVKNFWIYHEENPRVYASLIRFANEVKRSGRNKYSIVALFERIRWHYQIETTGDDFKLNNNYRSCYARMLMLEHSEFEGMFETRLSPGTRSKQ